jgi:aromatic-L-amino-acid decarboxylase
LPSGITDEIRINEINERLLQTLNASGKLYMTHTKLNGKYTLRMVIAQTYVEKYHVENAWRLIRETAKTI